MEQQIDLSLSLSLSQKSISKIKKKKLLLKKKELFPQIKEISIYIYILIFAIISSGFYNTWTFFEIRWHSVFI